jgi:branched-chain amino acid aminotransferase
MNSIYSVVNGEFILKDEAAIGISDLAIMRGFGVFYFFRTINYQPVFLEDHFDRFYFSASEMLMEVGYERNQLHKIIQELIDKNKILDSGIRITLTGGYSEDNYSMSK